MRSLSALIVPAKPGNLPEGAGGGKGGIGVWNCFVGTQEVTMNTEEYVSTKMEQIAVNAKRLPEVSFTSLAHHIDQRWLYDAYKNTRRDGALGVDEQSAEEYAENLEENLERLEGMFKTGRYKAPPVKRVYIPKDGKDELRPLGIPTFEDKVLQRAVKWVMEPIYEQDFYDCSYGFRPNRGAHDALRALWKGLMGMKGGWIIDLDIRKYFDTIQWNKLNEVLKRRVSDGVLIRTIGKWMNAGIMEEGAVWYPEEGTPQGGVISPLLSNIFLHYVLDEWLHETVFPRMKGKAFEIRYADDAVICFEREEDARRVLEVLPKRLEKHGLEMHPVKTRLVRFTKPANAEELKHGARPGTFNFLGFKHYWKKSRKGNLMIARKTERDRLSRALAKMADWCKEVMHRRIKEQHKELSRKLKGYYGYFGITGNYPSLSNYIRQVERIWMKWLNRRSRKRNLNWIKMGNILKLFPLPSPKIVHSYA
jgi:group II intron reverse transcriptase/maturase